MPIHKHLMWPDFLTGAMNSLSKNEYAVEFYKTSGALALSLTFY